MQSASSSILTPRKTFALLLSILLLAVFSASQGAAQAPDTRNIHVVTRHNDNQRTGQYLAETALTTANVNPASFGLLYAFPVLGEIYAQPLYVSNMSIGGGTHDVVFIATAHNDIYAYDAMGQNMTPYWHVNLGPSVPSGVIGTPNLPVEVGTISTPAIDLAAGTIYVCSKDYFGNVQRFHLHALDLTTGADKVNTTGTTGYGVLIAAQVNGNGDGNDGAGHVPFRAGKENQRCAVTLANGNVYLAFAGHEDYGPYHGWVLSYNALTSTTSTITQNGIHCNTPNGGGGGIWMSGEGLIVDSTGSLYYVGGNGTYNGAVGGNGKWDGVSNLGESVVKLAPNCSVSDWFTPQNYDYLNSIDADLSSSGGMILTLNGVQTLVAAGKEGKLYVMAPNNLTKFNAGTDQITQEWQVSGGHIHSSKAFWNSPTGPVMYVWGESDYLKSFKHNGTAFLTSPSAQSSMIIYPGYANGPGLAISANNSTAGSGILWSSLPYDGDAVHRHVGGIFRAFDASDVSRELWNSKMSAGDDTGVWAKWAPPMIVKGKVFLPSFSNKLLVYGVLPPNPPVAPTNLAAIGGNNLVALSWTAAPRATTYNVRRSLTANGPYTTIKTGAVGAYYTDSAAVNNTTYYYVVSAVNQYGESANSNEDSATPNAAAMGTTVGLSFVGSGTAMGAGEVAGVVPTANWNNCVGASGTLGQITDNLGLPAGASVTWNAAGTWAVGVSDAPGDSRMMNGYLDTGATSTTTVTVTGLPASFTANGYDVYVYCDGDNTSTVGLYTLGSGTIQARDNANFAGTFTQASASAGNYVVFSNQNAASFTLSATPDQSVNGFRAPVNAIQIVARTAGIPAPANLTATAGNAQVLLNWNAVSGATSYKVKRGATAGGPYTTIASSIAATTYTDTTVTNGVTYYYVVTASSATSTSGNSNEASATPQMPDFGLTAAPSTFGVIQGGSAASQIAVPSIGGLSAYVDLTVSGLPTGVTGTLLPVRILTDRLSVLTLAAATNAPVGTYTITVKGVSGSITHTTPITLTVAAPVSSGNGIFGINFQGGITNGPDGTAMGAAELAGVVPAANWNNAPGVTGSLSGLHDSAGTNTGLAIDWNSANTWDVGIPDTAGNNRMMKGYLDTDDSSVTTITVSGLDPSLTYKITVYADGDGANGRVGHYSIGSEEYYLSDNSSFNGSTFTQVTSTNQNAPGVGNVMVFTVTGQAAVTLNAQAFAGGPPRAPVNGIQIVSQGRTVSGTITLDSAVNPAQPVTFVFRDFTTGAIVAARTQTLTAVPGTSGGAFSLTGIPSGKFHLAVKGAINLQKVVTVNALSGNVSNVTATLPGGDADSNNIVDIGDFGVLVNAYGSAFASPGSGYDSHADFNFDGLIDIADFGILVNSYGSGGDL